VSQHKIQNSICEQHKFDINLPECHFTKFFNPRAAGNICERPQEMQFVSSTNYLNIRWDGQFVVILVSFVSFSIPVFY
jgi:hypothetical protein